MTGQNWVTVTLCTVFCESLRWGLPCDAAVMAACVGLDAKAVKGKGALARSALHQRLGPIVTLCAEEALSLSNGLAAVQPRGVMGEVPRGGGDPVYVAARTSGSSAQ